MRLVRLIRWECFGFVLCVTLAVFSTTTYTAKIIDTRASLTASLTGDRLRRSLLAVTTSAHGTLSKADATGICTYSGSYVSCLDTAVFDSVSRDLWISLTGAGCAVGRQAYRISEDGRSAIGNISGLAGKVSVIGQLIHVDVIYPGQQVPVCSTNSTVTSGTLLGVEAPTETESSKSSCFPGSALVQTRSGAKLMRHVRLGDEVLTLIPGRVPTYETVFMFSHLDDAVSASFMRITLASGAALTVTSDHYVWACQCQACQAKLVSAGKVRQDMCMWVASHDGTVLDRVVATSTIAEYGLYNPHTKSGSILVNNIATSTFTKVLPASLIVHKLVTYPLYLLSKLLHMAQVDEAFNGLILNLHSAVSTARLFEYPRFVHTVLWATPPFQCR